MDDISDIDPRETAFHSAVREYIICLLIFLALYVLSYTIICALKSGRNEEPLYDDEEDGLVYRISVWMCTFSLAVSIAAVLLLPFSIFSNEILILYPNNYYIQWLNSSLVHSLWTYVFFSSNLSVFILLPFSYFFIESQGFGHKKGIKTRVYESLALCALLIVVVFCLAHLISILLDDERSRNESLFKIWNYQLPFIYSCVSLFGVATLLTCTPMGFARMFSEVGDLVVKPKSKRDIGGELKAVELEEATLKIKLNGVNGVSSNGFHLNGHNECHNGSTRNGYSSKENQLAQLTAKRKCLEEEKRSSRWFQNLRYPFVMLILLALTGISVLMVVSNTFQLLIGFRSLPEYKQYMELGDTSLSTLGCFGALLETVIIFYIMMASMVGLYSVPVLGRMRPSKGQTSMTKVIGNCSAVLILSSALPVLVRTIGITSFDLLGAYGKIDWLGNFYLVLSYNAIFAIATGLCLVTKFTSSIRNELYRRFNEASMRIRNRHKSADSNSTAELSPLPTHQTLWGPTEHDKAE